MSYKILSVRSYGNKHNCSWITGATESGIEIEIKIPSNTEEREVADIDAELRGLLDKAMKGLIDPPKVYLPAPNPEGDDYHAVQVGNLVDIDDLWKPQRRMFNVYAEDMKLLEETACRTEYNIPGWPTNSDADKAIFQSFEIYQHGGSAEGNPDSLKLPPDLVDSSRKIYSVTQGGTRRVLYPNQDRIPVDDEQPEQEQHWFNRPFTDKEWDELINIPDITKNKEGNHE